jgi:carboxyl-terminal processing protease
MTFLGEYASCNVAPGEVGMFADLDMVVLCNENTASAAEVFTATLYDHGLAHVIGETTFGKGIMQTFLALSDFGDYQGYAKMTTHAYVTKRGENYHEIGVAPHETVKLSDEAKQYHFYLLPQEKDNQLQAAIAHFE